MQLPAMTRKTVIPLCGTIGIEMQPMIVPRPIGYGVKVAGKMVAFITPDLVETAYLRFQEMAERRRQHEEKLGIPRRLP